MAGGKKAKKGGGKKQLLSGVELERARTQEMDRRCCELALLRRRLEEIVEEEERMTGIATNSIQARWIVFLRECKQKELIAEINVLRRNFESTVDRKEARAKLLGEELCAAEQQCKQAFSSHMAAIDSLRELHNRHMSELKEDFSSHLDVMQGDFDAELRELSAKHKCEIGDLQLILDNMAAEAEAADKLLQEEISESHETAAEKMDEERRQMESQLTKTSEEVRTELDSRYKNFMSTAQTNMKDYMEKSKEDQETTEQIATQLSKIEKLQGNVKAWRTNIARNTKEWEQRNTSVTGERDSTMQNLKDLKHKMHTWRQRQSQDLADLVKSANDAEDNLQSTASKAERILRVVELCKPLETEREQVLLHEAHASPEAIEEEVKQRLAAGEDASAAHARDGTNSSNGAWQFLDRFWIRHNKVVLDNAALRQEMSVLEEENRQLQAVLKQYLDDVSVNDNVMQSNNALLQTVAAPNVVEYAKNSSGQRYLTTNVVEGNKFMSEQSRQRA